MIHVHLDPLGGLAGDMFAAALLSAFPGHEPAVARAVALAAPVRCRTLPHADGVLAGLRFRAEDAQGRLVDAAGEPDRRDASGHGGAAGHGFGHGLGQGGGEDGRHGSGRGSAHGHGGGHDHGHVHGHDHGHAHDHAHDRGHRHDGEGGADGPGQAGVATPGVAALDIAEAGGGHRPWRSIRSHLLSCGLAPGVSAVAVGIFSALAWAEARVHGVSQDEVAFHEVGAADSIADVVAAAVLVEAIGPARWSVAALPLGSGRVRTAHGPMPVPAPATALLLDGFEVLDDGIGGERVTPTGAAILRFLREDGRMAPRPPGRLGASGTGFGSRTLPGISNCLRALVIEPTREPEAAGRPAGHRSLAVVCFEVDDQSGEDLASGLERIRACPGVHDVVQMPAFGKKGRLAVHVQVLAAPGSLDGAVEACFRETTTIGLRTHLVQGRALHRRMAQAEVDGVAVAVKCVERPDGPTGKAEADHLLSLPGHAARARLRRRAEAQVLDEERVPDGSGA